MFNLVHQRNAPNNAFTFEVTLYKSIGMIGVGFIHPDHPDVERRVFPDMPELNGKPWPIGKLEADYDCAIKLRDALTKAIDELEAFPHKKDWIRHNGRPEN